MRALRSSRSSPLRQVRLFVARRPLVYWLVVALLAAATAGMVLQRTSAADAARRRWGEQRPVLVATRDLRPGDTLGPGDTRTERWPLALLPADAVASVDDATVVSAGIGMDEPLVRRRLGRGGAGPVAAALPPGTRGVGLPRGDAPLPVQPGDRVDVVAAGVGTGGTVVAAGVPVLRVDDLAVVVAVEAGDLPAVAEALVGASVVLAISGDPPAG